MTPDEFRSHGHALIDVITEYLETIEHRPVTSHVQAGEVMPCCRGIHPSRRSCSSGCSTTCANIVIPGLTNWQTRKQFFAYFPENSVRVDPRRAG